MSELPVKPKTSHHWAVIDAINHGAVTEPKAVIDKIKKEEATFKMRTGQKPFRLFLSINLCEELLVEMLGAGTGLVKKTPGAPNKFEDMIVYRVVEPDIVSVSL